MEAIILAIVSLFVWGAFTSRPRHTGHVYGRTTRKGR